MSGPLSAGVEAGRPSVLSLNIRERGALYASYIPQLTNGGIFIPTNRQHRLGDEVPGCGEQQDAAHDGVGELAREPKLVVGEEQVQEHDTESGAEQPDDRDEREAAAVDGEMVDVINNMPLVRAFCASVTASAITAMAVPAMTWLQSLVVWPVPAGPMCVMLRA